MALHLNVHRPTRNAKVTTNSVSGTHWVTIEDTGYGFNVFTDTAEQAERIAAVLIEMVPAPPPVEPEDNNSYDIPF